MTATFLMCAVDLDRDLDVDLDLDLDVDADLDFDVVAANTPSLPPHQEIGGLAISSLWFHVS
jgi:hypothetical protein